jgi:EmrB/QacA subfamily drug resistance transporter
MASEKNTKLPSQAGSARPRISWLGIAGLLVGPFLSMVDTNVLVVAIPNIAASMRTSTASAQWTLSAYLIAIGAALPASGYLARRFGIKRVYWVSLLAFTVASGLCAAAPTMATLIIARIIQGVAAAPMVPMFMALVFSSGSGMQEDFGGRSGRSTAAVIFFLAPALGPTIGGAIIAAASWRVLFLINLPIGLVGMLGMRQAARSLPADHSDPGARLDAVGLLLLAAGLGLILYAIGAITGKGWLAPGIWPFWSAGALLLALYAVWANKQSAPAVRLDILLRVQNSIAMAIITIASVVLFGILFLVPVIVRDGQHHSSLAAGLVLLPQGVAMGLSSDLGERIGRTGRFRLTVIIGMAVMTASTAAMLVVNERTALWLTALILAGRGLSVGFVVTPVIAAMLKGLSEDEVSDASTFFNVSQRLASGLGIAAISTLFQSYTSHYAVTGHGVSASIFLGFHQTVLILAIVSAVGLLSSLALHDPQAREAG